MPPACRPVAVGRSSLARKVTGGGRLVLREKMVFAFPGFVSEGADSVQQTPRDRCAFRRGDRTPPFRAFSAWKNAGNTRISIPSWQGQASSMSISRSLLRRIAK